MGRVIGVPGAKIKFKVILFCIRKNELNGGDVPTLDLNLKHLRYFWAVAREGNLTRAAERLHVSQSAVSVQIKNLEDDLGTALFERRGRQLTLTEAGRIAFDHADAIFGLTDELVAALAQGSVGQRVLRIGAVTTLSRNFQLGFVQPLLGRTDVEVVIRSGLMRDLLRSLEAHQLDVVLATSPPARDAATAWTPHAVGKQPVSVVGRPELAEGGRSLEELLREEFLVLPTVESSIRTGFDALLESLGIRARIAAEVDDMAMLRLMAREHHGLAVVPPVVVRDELKNGVLVEIERLPHLHETFFAVTSQRRFANPLLTELLSASALGEEGLRRASSPCRGGLDPVPLDEACPDWRPPP